MGASEWFALAMYSAVLALATWLLLRSYLAVLVRRLLKEEREARAKEERKAKDKDEDSCES